MKNSNELLKAHDWFNKEDLKVVWNNDSDGIFCAGFLEEFKGWKPFSYYDFNQMVLDNTYIVDGNITVTKNEIVYVDVAIEGNKRTIDMHITKISHDDKTNPNSLNPNHHIARNNYTDKCAWGAIIAILSYINYDFSVLSDEAKMILWGVDSGFLSYFFNSNTFYKWVEFYGVQELASVFSKYNKSDFEKVQYKYGLQGTIKTNKDGYIYTTGVQKKSGWCPAINFKAIQEYFPFVKLPETKQTPYDIGLQSKKFDCNSTKSKHDLGCVFSFALNGKQYGQYSIR